MNDYFAYEIFYPDRGYCLFIHIDEVICDDQACADIDPDHDHYRLGTIHDCTSIQDAIQHIADDEWDYEEHNL